MSEGPVNAAAPVPVPLLISGEQDEEQDEGAAGLIAAEELQAVIDGGDPPRVQPSLDAGAQATLRHHALDARVAALASAHWHPWHSWIGNRAVYVGSRGSGH